jgi:hypothetical protein
MGLEESRWGAFWGSPWKLFDGWVDGRVDETMCSVCGYLTCYWFCGGHAATVTPAQVGSLVGFRDSCEVVVAVYRLIKISEMRPPSCTWRLCGRLQSGGGIARNSADEKSSWLHGAGTGAAECWHGSCLVADKLLHSDKSKTGSWLRCCTYLS